MKTIKTRKIRADIMAEFYNSKLMDNVRVVNSEKIITITSNIENKMVFIIIHSNKSIEYNTKHVIKAFLNLDIISDISDDEYEHVLFLIQYAINHIYKLFGYTAYYRFNAIKLGGYN